MICPQVHKAGCRFRVWAPERKEINLRLGPRNIPMEKDAHGYFNTDVKNIGDGARYSYELDGKTYPDPASACQPDGVYGPSAVVDHRIFVWSDAAWHVPPFSNLIFYEIHVGTFTPQGTFDAIIPRLNDLAALGINALELMPVASCSGERNWGYDGAFLYAVQNKYGGPHALKRLIDAAHARGIAVFLDVVYNHIGREGNNLEAFAPYFTEQYHTPWGKAMNYDGPRSDGVREFVITNALYWAEHFHIDGLRLDAIHEIYDRNAITIWDDLNAAIKAWEQRSGRRCYLVAESDANDPKVVQPNVQGGHGFDAQWMDDFHHCLYVLLDRDGGKHYKDFGGIEQLAKAYTQGFVHTGEYLHFRHRRHGAPSAGIAGEKFIVFNQNHDLPGNRPGGERLANLVGPDTLKLAAAAILLSPYIPLLFMGEEYGEDTPFFFFSDYQEPATSAGQIDGRQKQFADFAFEGEVLDPQDPALFERSILHWEKRSSGNHRDLLEWHRELILLRRTHPLLADLSKRFLRADIVGTHGLSVYRYSGDGSRHLVCLFNFSHADTIAFPLSYTLASTTPAQEPASWQPLLGSGTTPVPLGHTVHLSPQAVAVYELINPSPGSPPPATK